MLLTRHALEQIDIDYLKTRAPEELLAVSLKLLQDLQEAHDRFNQRPDNSSRPLGSFAPGENTVIDAEEDDAVSKKAGLAASEEKKGKRKLPHMKTNPSLKNQESQKGLRDMDAR